MDAIQFLVEWGLRSAALILCGAFLLWALRVKDSSVRLAAWVAMVAGSLLLPLMTVALPRVPIRVMPAAPSPMAASYEAGRDFDVTASRNEVVVSKPVAKMSAPSDWGLLALSVYGSVALFLFLRLSIGLVLSLRLLRRSREAGHTADGIEIRESEWVASPVTLGIVRPLIVLPVDWSEWGQEKLNAVLAHERSHIRRRDPAVQLVSAIHRALLWHNPLSWFLHLRIVSAAEDASDDAAVAVTADRISYAEVLLEFMQRPALKSNLAGVPMARYGRTDGRIDRILDGTLISRGVTRWSVAAILVLGVPLSYLVASSRPEHAVSRIAASVRSVIPETVVAAPLPLFDRLPEAPPLIAQAVPPPVVPPAPDTRPRFDVASIKPCDPNAATIGGRGGKSAGPTARYRRNCVTVKSLIENAYIRFADGKNRNPMMTVLTGIEGGPGWINSDQYTIEAESESAATPMMMDGPMMQTLLEDRFQLKVHRENRDGPVYALTVAKGGPKMQHAKEGSCLQSDFVDSPFPFLQPPAGMEDMQCRFNLNWRKGPNVIKSARYSTMEDVAASLTLTMDRLVIDKTGITGQVDFRLTFSPDDTAPRVPPAQSADGVPVADDPAGPTLVTALQEQLGLKLEPAKGNRDYLVIDNVSRPSPN